MKEEQTDNSESPSEETSVSIPTKKSAKRKVIGFSILLIIIIVGGFFGFEKVQFYQTHVETEDAQIDGTINPVLSRVSGYINEVYIEDNEAVKKGQLLVEIDSTEYALKVDMANAALENSRAKIHVAEANLRSTEIAKHKAKTDFKRAKDLYEGGAATKSKLDDASTAYAAAKSQVTTAQRRLTEAQAQINTRNDDLVYAKLQLSYTKIKAPSDGLISKKNVSKGQLIRPGQPLMAVTDVHDVWVVANFKETELSDIKIGQKVEIFIDAYPDKTFHGRVESIAGATGAKYALLPPENATGNFVKVVQRIPVKIKFTQREGANYPIPLGLNVLTSIDVNQKAEATDIAVTAPKKSN